MKQSIAGYSGQLPVAVKTLSSRDPEMVRKFMEEAELMKKFSHQNIVSLLGIYVWCLYIILYALHTQVEVEVYYLPQLLEN